MKTFKIVKRYIFFLAISLLLQNCEKEELTNLKVDPFQTVSFEEAKEIFTQKIYQNKNSQNIVIEPQWETMTQDPLDFTDALLTNVIVKIENINFYGFLSKVLFLEINNEVFKIIETTFSETSNPDGSIKDGKVYYHFFNGLYCDGFKVSNGKATHRLIKKSTGARSLNRTDDCDEDLVEGTAFCDATLDEIVIVSSSSSSQDPRYIVIHNFLDGNIYDNGGSTTDGIVDIVIESQTTLLQTFQNL